MFFYTIKQRVNYINVQLIKKCNYKGLFQVSKIITLPADETNITIIYFSLFYYIDFDK